MRVLVRARRDASPSPDAITYATVGAFGMGMSQKIVLTTAFIMPPNSDVPLFPPRHPKYSGPGNVRLVGVQRLANEAQHRHVTRPQPSAFGLALYSF
jgi:hypothetical protein